MKTTITLVILLVSCFLLALGLTIGVLLLSGGYDLAPAIFAGVVTLFGIAGIAWASYSVKLYRLVALVVVVGLAAVGIPRGLKMTAPQRTMAMMRKLAEKDPAKAKTGRDAWGNDFRFEVIEYADRSKDYFIGSAGSDGKFENEHLTDYTPGATTSFESDIIFSKGTFLRYPVGTR